MAVDGKSAQAKLARAILLALSTGTFFFIGMWEMLPRSLQDGHLTWAKMTSCILGFAVMAVIGIWV